MAQQDGGEYFWFASFVSSGATSTDATTFAGTVLPTRGETRIQLFTRITDELRESRPDLRDAAVVAFDLQPNKL